MPITKDELLLAKLDIMESKLDANTTITNKIAESVLGDGSKQKPGLSGRVLLLEEARKNQRVWSGAAITAAVATLITAGWNWLSR